MPSESAGKNNWEKGAAIILTLVPVHSHPAGLGALGLGVHPGIGRRICIRPGPQRTGSGANPSHHDLQGQLQPASGSPLQAASGSLGTPETTTMSNSNFKGLLRDGVGV
jgi:hypothetical protein